MQIHHFKFLNCFLSLNKSICMFLTLMRFLLRRRTSFLRVGAHHHFLPLFRRIFTPFEEPQKAELFGSWISQVEVELVSKELRDGIARLQNLGCQVIGLTNMVPGAGECGTIKSMEDFRYNELKVRGIDFSANASLKNLELDFKMKNGRAPKLENSILYARPYTKGEVLKRYLELCGDAFEKIWFVDNNRRNVDNVAGYMTEYRIPYTGIHYLDKKFSEEEYSPKLGRFQFAYFERTGKWLNDEEAIKQSIR